MSSTGLGLIDATEVHVLFWIDASTPQGGIIGLQTQTISCLAVYNSAIIKFLFSVFKYGRSVNSWLSGLWESQRVCYFTRSANDCGSPAWTVQETPSSSGCQRNCHSIMGSPTFEDSGLDLLVVSIHLGLITSTVPIFMSQSWHCLQKCGILVMWFLKSQPCCQRRQCLPCSWHGEHIMSVGTKYILPSTVNNVCYMSFS